MALLISVVATYVLYARIRRQFSIATRPVKVVASAKLLEPGTPLSADALTLMEWPVNIPLEGSFHNPQEVIGRIVMYPIAAKEPIRDQFLAAAGATVGLTAKIPDGMRALAVQTNEVNNVSGFLFPGSHVDVLVTFRPDSSRDNRDSMTTTVLQDVEVLSAGEKLQADPSGKPQNVKQVTLLLTPPDAEKLVLASNQGTVQFVLRNSSDQQQEQTRPVQLRDLQTSAPVTAVAGKKAPAPIRTAQPFKVEAYDGAKKSVLTF